jgi:hypothetical protein
MLIDACETRLETLGPKGNRPSSGDVPPDLSMIIWKATTGPKGPFEIAESKANANNAPFARLTEYLNSHDKKATVSGFFVWAFTDGSGSIGRKLAQKQT